MKTILREGRWAFGGTSASGTARGGFSVRKLSLVHGPEEKICKKLEVNGGQTRRKLLKKGGNRSKEIFSRMRKKVERGGGNRETYYG